MKSTLFAAVAICFATQAMAQSTDATAFKTTQSVDEWRVVNYLGQPIVNSTGEKIGTVNDLLFDRSGKVTTVVIGLGGFLGLGQKRVALPFEAVTYTEREGQREITVPLTKEALMAAPDFTLTEQTALDKVKEQAGEVASKASEKAGELKDQAVKKIEEYRKDDSGAPAQQR